MFTQEAQTILRNRRGVGARAIELVWGSKITNDEDWESAAKDAISDILTALFGPAGKLTDDRSSGRARVELDLETVDKARAFVLAAYEAYTGDAEDYVELTEERQPEPGQYGYEEPEPVTEITLRLGDSGWEVIK